MTSGGARRDDTTRDELIGLLGQIDVEAVVISQAIRNALETFHGGGLGPGGDRHGFLTDDSMRRLSICIRRTVYDALCNLAAIIEGKPGTETWDPLMWAGFQLGTCNPGTMEWPGTRELEAAFKEFVIGYEGEEDVP
jgi:hypothetical protein